MPGDVVVVAGSTDNDATYIIDTVTATTITTVETSITTETAGDTVTLIRNTAPVAG